ncbi:ankyrin [Purpureocillium lavendulum]|uniref:Ankyrin n=1 Tax=Purpureocillium lavendulum TaxID=1247861 RepID=A0AB34FIN1_9HYPO|nr:ankyrin [Purpureocillium lavendulum]
MSFGVTMDLAVLVRRAIDMRKKWVNAPAQFQEVSDEVRRLSIAIQDFDIALVQWQLSDENRENVRSILAGSRDVLTELEEIVEKNQGIAGSGGTMGDRLRRTRHKAHWRPDDISTLRERISANIAVLNTFLGRLSTGIAVETKRGVDQLNQRQAAQDCRAILNWLTPVDISVQQHDHFRRRQPETGQWLLESPEYQSWLRDHGQILLCKGVPGAGKTILSAVVVDHLHQACHADPTIGIGYLYCNLQQRDEQTIDHFLASLLKQLVGSEPPPGNTMDELSTRHSKQPGDRLEATEILTYLRSAVGAYSRTFVVIDALDESSNPNGLLSSLVRLQTDFDLNILATSRLDHEKAVPDHSVSLTIRALDADVRRFAVTQLSHNLIFATCQPDLQDEIVTHIINAADGIFLLAKLHLDSLDGMVSKKALRATARGLKAGPKAYERVYDDAMARIASQPQGQHDLAMQTLMWMTFARQPLTASALQHALAVEIGERKLDDENMPPIELVVSVCAGLVTVESESQIIRLAHGTTSEYLKKTQDRWFSDVGSRMAKICFAYLSFDAFSDGPCTSTAAIGDRLLSYPFYAYAACNWGYHVNYAAEPAILDSLMEFAVKDEHVQASAQVLPEHYGSPYTEPNLDCRTTILHLMIRFRMVELFPDVLQQYPNPDAKDWLGDTALLEAVQRGETEIVRCLLETGEVDPDSINGIGRTPLFWAAGMGNEAIVDLLLAHGAQPDSLGPVDTTPLSIAAMEGEEAMVRRLLLEGVDVNRKHPTFGPKSASTLYTVRISGQDALIVLFGRSIDGMAATSVESYGPKGAGDLAKNLIRMMDPSEYDGVRAGKSPLLVSDDPALLGRVELVLVRGARRPGEYGETLLHFASRNGYTSMAKVLLAAGATPHIKDEFERTPLRDAAAEGHVDVVKMLLSTGAVDASATDAEGKTALDWATKKGHREIVELLTSYEGLNGLTGDLVQREVAIRSGPGAATAG